MRLHLDIETFSEVDLPKCGVYRYAEDPSTEILCIAWALEEGPVNLWKPGQPLGDLLNDIKRATILAAHNAQFERVVLTGPAGQKIGFPTLPISKWMCTAAKAAVHALPRSLDKCALALGLTKKDLDGKRVMLKLSRPRKPTKINLAVRYTYDQAPQDFEVLYAYCVNDVVVEREIDHTLADLLPAEQKMWEFDQLINNRGLQVDLSTVHKVLGLAAEYSKQLSDECVYITGSAPGQRDKIMKWCVHEGYPLAGYTALDIRTHLDDPGCSGQVHRVLTIRAETSRTSVKKYDAIARAVCTDQRIKGMFLYHGAGTGRWAGRLVQLQNLPRGKFKKMTEVAEQIAAGDLPWLTALYNSPMDAFSTAIRPMIIAAPGRKFITSDFSNIEGRVLAWLAGETWKLKAFDDFDKGTGPDLYLVSAARIYNCSIEEAKQHRQMGKVAELALGFGGGVGAFAKMADIYGVKLKPALASIYASSTADMIDKAEWLFNHERKTNADANHDEYIAAELVKQLWRQAHPKTCDFWRDLEAAMKEAILMRKTVHVGRVKVFVKNDFMYMKLPSGRSLAYYKPEITVTKSKWGAKDALTFMSENAVTGQWGRESTYGGSLVENAVQAVARDFLVSGMYAVEQAGYPVIGHVHDEIISEVPSNFGSVLEFEQLMTTFPAWGHGIPLASSGWEGLRYKK